MRTIHFIFACVAITSTYATAATDLAAMTATIEGAVTTQTGTFSASTSTVTTGSVIKSWSEAENFPKGKVQIALVLTSGSTFQLIGYTKNKGVNTANGANLAIFDMDSRVTTALKDGITRGKFVGQGIIHPAALSGAETLFVNGSIRMRLGDDAAPQKMVIKCKAFGVGTAGSLVIRTGDRITVRLP